MTDREIFRANINHLMDVSGCTQQRLADYVGVERTTVSAWMRGKGYPRADVMARIAQYFDVKLSDLVMLKDELYSDERILKAWRNADPTYQTVALELLESHPKKEQEQSAI